jgi:hypothetical protein
MLLKTFRSAGGLSHKDAQVAGEFLDDKFGDAPITAQDFVEAARPSDAPVHHLIEWNNKRAADLYRLDQARYVMRSITVVVEIAGEEEETRAYHHVTVDTDEGPKEGYVRQEIVWETPEARDQIIRRAIGEISAWQERYKQYQELAVVHEAVGKLLRERAHAA